jgi:diaminopimelate decarboxylase
MELARASGFLAEAISLLELQKALQSGFQTSQVILNGPGKWWPQTLLPTSSLYAVVCDSLADLRRVARSMDAAQLKSEIVSIRLRPPHIPSRFGIPVDSPEALSELVSAVATLPRQCSFGVHFHMASSNIGVGQWWHLYESTLRWCCAIEALTKRRIEHLDVGGGWFPDDWYDHSETRFADAIQRVRNQLPGVKEIISEPGKAMAQPTMALGMRLLELMDDHEEVRDAVVDGSIAELPMHFHQPHRILHQDSRTGAWQALKRGRTKLLGRLCMEHDVLASNVELPDGAAAGDLLVFCDAGAYDRSMSYVFGRG